HEADVKVADIMKRTAVKAVRAQGLIDTFIVAGKPWTHTLPTRAYDSLQTREESGSRLDYIFCSSDFAVRDAYVVQNELTDRASDHYPVVAVLELNN
ncbi:MAG TPA: endonuclease/exonuclease/phosphatase family protein, partial [Candidatus Nanoarchaeia archaeon]|nr:endonuclease/exonuclease/phosphatase family protein [Candidatus Nanoarchaeia archaeon]